jgi:hypothetical protein
MEPESLNSDIVLAFFRCRHTYVNGKRCRLPLTDTESAFCVRHARLPENQINPDNTANLTAGLTQFTSAEPVNEFLSRLLLLLGQNRISPRRAAVLAHIANQILRTVAVMDRKADTPENRLKAFVESTPVTAYEVEYLAAELARAQRELAESENNSLHSAGAREYRST